MRGLETVVLHLISTDFRMEASGIQLASAMFEKLGTYDEGFLKKLLFGIFTTLHFYRNNTKQKLIPISIIKSVHVFLSTFMITSGTAPLMQTCNSIQKNILFMILTSEGDKIKHVGSGHGRERKYALVAYSRFVMDTIAEIP